MKSTKTYLLELYVKRYKININESGSVGLLLRAGKSQSQVTEMKPIIKGVINFNTNIKLNIDQSALDTQRCTLTLNFRSVQNVRKVIGIVVINLPHVNEQIQKSFRITSTPDKEAQIELNISVSELDENMRVVRKKELIENKKDIIEMRKQSIVQNFKNVNSEESTLKTSLKGDSQIVSSKLTYEELIATIQKLQREKQLLKQLLRLEMAKSFKAQTHLKNIIDVLQISIGINIATFPQDTLIRNSLPGDSLIMKKHQTQVINKMNFSQYGPQINSNSVSFLGTVQESRFQDGLPPLESRVKSHISFSSEKSVDLLNVLTLLKNNMETNGMSKNDIRKMFDKLKTQPQLQFDQSKIRILKTKIDRSYLGLIGKQTITKDEILKHKIDLNKILDDVVNTIVVVR